MVSGGTVQWRYLYRGNSDRLRHLCISGKSSRQVGYEFQKMKTKSNNKFTTLFYFICSAGSPGLCLVLWCVCGVYSLLGAIAYCEIGTLIPKSGGEYIYFLEAFGPTHKFFGPILAFIFAWVTVFLINPSSVAILSLSFVKYFSSPILTAVNFCPDDYLTYVLDRLLATICIGPLTFVNCYSIKGATHVQNIFTVGKLTAIAIIIGGGLYYLGLGYTENLEIGFEGSASSFGQIATAFYGGLWAYSGWNNLKFITEELKNPYRNLPLAIIIALPLTTICYVLINVSYLTVLTPQQIISSHVVDVDWGDAVLGCGLCQFLYSARSSDISSWYNKWNVVCCRKDLTCSWARRSIS
ncbi:b(0,+)-type amino acid transporter 1-like isoform X1 [Daphnia pulicaria]|uniref:b(0,+)-type amino acid transporter 1-like isoform X1 n=1 Tax=Daphnia pulicaria TaxID=35523 RepID=UPI001EEADF10|nr:b(0,+)-type amino acid transporter 1-like isoform X1 [Daphnia pulicaria]XP_046656691.1 b(0,+)-type amino acid transporter 1-like isoform X1 [Daphnia pulicaria]XP_046656692.1 b(0,+)-type amino acid transporter 1-like isoform X1 [Daphnia pulicaria]XP_046656693.1 b(0,+)-type amino acid transporter 1-like isoform X1 [Daphnia pulicaria]XP_046656694.1 b(0,+)-type amino acid transporter 1-like isoform X1 [Daphnia pulicaria]